MPGFILTLFLAFFVVVGGSDPTCKPVPQSGYIEGQCPVKLTPVRSQPLHGIYTEDVTVEVWLKTEELCRFPEIKICCSQCKTLRPQCGKKKHHKRIVKCKRSSQWWKLEDKCQQAKNRETVSVFFNGSCSDNYTVKEPVPDFDLSVNPSSRSVNVTVNATEQVYTRWCYLQDSGDCMESSRPKTIDPSQSKSAVHTVSYLLPCLCIQAYFGYTDATRKKKCMFLNKTLIDFRDVFRSSEVTVFSSSLKWRSECPARQLNISASLCWMQHQHLCTPVLDFPPENKNTSTLIYNTSLVDKHPQMCVQFSTEGINNVTCPFKADKPSWEVHIGMGKQSIWVYINSSSPAKFLTQLCVLVERGCVPIGAEESLATEGNHTEKRIIVPPGILAENPCLQVWRSDPALRGKRILCPDYTHYRSGTYAAAALMLVFVVALLGIYVYHVTKSAALGLLNIQKPLLLVCSTEQLAHVTAACALASMLQGELGATVHTALWTQSSQSQARMGTSVADLGPLPWLYGQWEAVCEAQGKMLIVWSAEAKKTYKKWREKRKDIDRTKNACFSEASGMCQKTRVELKENLKQDAQAQRNCKKEKAGRKKGSVKSNEDKELHIKTEPSTVIEPVFTAVLTCLETALQEGKSQDVAIVYFQGLSCSRDIPKAFRNVPRYCLPQNFSGLIQGLREVGRTKNGKFSWHCWPRLISKVLTLFLARQLAQRLQTKLPQTRGNKRQSLSITSSINGTLAKTEKAQVASVYQAENCTRSGAPLLSPERTETLCSQVSHD
ncbi:uncharacterized protein KZ484_015163 [Pholidichthys leucotaenia]